MKRLFSSTVLLLLSCAGPLEDIKTDTEQNADMLGKCRAEARKAYYLNDAGLNASLGKYEECKKRDAGGEK